MNLAWVLGVLVVDLARHIVYRIGWRLCIGYYDTSKTVRRLEYHLSGLLMLLEESFLLRM